MYYVQCLLRESLLDYDADGAVSVESNDADACVTAAVDSTARSTTADVAVVSVEHISMCTYTHVLAYTHK